MMHDVAFGPRVAHTLALQGVYVQNGRGLVHTFMNGRPYRQRGGSYMVDPDYHPVAAPSWNLRARSAGGLWRVADWNI